MFREKGLYPDYIKTSDDLVKLPILTKENIRKNYEEIIAVNHKSFVPVESVTSGPTGSPLKYSVTKKQTRPEALTGCEEEDN